MRIRLTALAATAAVLLAGPVLAQDVSMEPTFGTLNLMTGYMPDPAVIPMIAGGDIDASSLGATCYGYIAEAPDFRVNYEAGTNFPLIISAVSEVDTTLVINAADGSWHCNDDSGNGLNPAVSFTSPPSGQYDIWVGVYGEAATAPAGLYISEVTTGGEMMESGHEH